MDLPFDPGWFDRCGWLEEPDEGAEQLLTGRLRRMSREQYAAPAYRSSRPLGPAGGTTFYLSHTVVRRTRRGPPPKIPSPEEAPPGRIFVFPGGAMSRADLLARQPRLDRLQPSVRLPANMCGQLKAMGGVYDRRRHCWHVPTGMVAKGIVPPTWCDEDAAGAWLTKRMGRPDGAPGTSARFQAYVERAEASEAVRRAEIESDALGEISLGTLGASTRDRILFWEEAEGRERPGGRVQHRVVSELPHWLVPADRRRIAVGFCRIFEQIGLPFYAVVHLPDVDEGSDPRNIHLHVLYTDRPFADACGEHRALARRKRREPAHICWPGILRSHHATVTNEVIAEAAARGNPPPVGRGYFDPRAHQEMGIEKEPGRHQGPWRIRLERSGVPTGRGMHNGWCEAMWHAHGSLSADLLIVQKLEAVLVRLHNATVAYPQSPELRWFGESAADVLDFSWESQAEQAANAISADLSNGRALRRCEWAEMRLAQIAERPTETRRLKSGRGSLSALSQLRDRLQEIVAEARAFETSTDAGPALARHSTRLERQARVAEFLDDLLDHVIAVSRMRECLRAAHGALAELDRTPEFMGSRTVKSPSEASQEIEWRGRVKQRREDAKIAREAVVVATRRLGTAHQKAMRAMARPNELSRSPNTCAFRRLRPPIPTDRDHLFRSIATSVARALAAPLDVDGDVSLPWVGQARQEPSR